MVGTVRRKALAVRRLLTLEAVVGRAMTSTLAARVEQVERAAAGTRAQAVRTADSQVATVEQILEVVAVGPGTTGILVSAQTLETAGKASSSSAT